MVSHLYLASVLLSGFNLDVLSVGEVVDTRRYPFEDFLLTAYNKAFASDQGYVGALSSSPFSSQVHEL